jgi:hypothetical protein
LDERKEHKICTCPCDNCKDGKLLDATYSLMELTLTRIDEGLVVSNDFGELAMVLITSTKIDTKTYGRCILCRYIYSDNVERL